MASANCKRIGVPGAPVYRKCVGESASCVCLRDRTPRLPAPGPGRLWYNLWQPLHPWERILDRYEELRQENQALRERLSRLSQASLRITEDLDLDAVLQGVVDGARSLTGARLGGITTLDESGEFQGFYTSGLTAEEHRMFLELPGGLELFAHLGRLAVPLRLADFSAHTRGLGLPEIPPPLGPLGSFLQAPIRLRSQQLGTIYLSDKAGSVEFSQGDEETLVLFASQAALAIANARRHREEQQARAGLETLVNTAPVGVVVFDARTEFPCPSTGRPGGWWRACGTRTRRRSNCWRCCPSAGPTVWRSR